MWATFSLAAHFKFKTAMHVSSLPLAAPIAPRLAFLAIVQLIQGSVIMIGMKQVWDVGKSCQRLLGNTLLSLWDT